MNCYSQTRTATNPPDGTGIALPKELELVSRYLVSKPEDNYWRDHLSPAQKPGVAQGRMAPQAQQGRRSCMGTRRPYSREGP